MKLLLTSLLIVVLGNMPGSVNLGQMPGSVNLGHMPGPVNLGHMPTNHTHVCTYNGFTYVADNSVACPTN